MEKSAIFIGSSVKGLQIADGIETNLKHDCISYKWSNVFEAGTSNLGNLLRELEKVDYAAFVFSPDDVLKMKGKEFLAARDNVIFELGLFMGMLGRERTFIVIPENEPNLHLPTDLDGIGILKYSSSTDNYKVNTSILCNDIRDRVRKLGKKKLK